MYVIIQLGTIWAVYDRESGGYHLLEHEHVEFVRSMFPNILGDRSFNAIQIQRVNPGKLLKLPATGYVIVRVGEAWTLYEGNKELTRTLEVARVNKLKTVFPAIVDNLMLTAIAVDVISPAKLSGLPTGVTSSGQIEAEVQLLPSGSKDKLLT